MSEKSKQNSIVERFVSSQQLVEEVKEERNLLSLRPKHLSDFPGQDKIKHNLHVYISAAKQNNRSLDHVIIHGPPGLGKTTLSHIIAQELGVDIVQTTAPVIEKPGDLAGILTSLRPNSVLFIDEIHRLNIVVEELLYSALEDYSIEVLLGQGPSSRSVKVDLSPFTLIGATTRLSNLSSPLVSRFGIQVRLDFYDVNDLQTIILRNSKLQNIQMSQDGARALAMRSRGTPRIANRLLRRVRDFAEFESIIQIEAAFVDKVLNHLQVDYLGLDSMDRQILQIIQDRYKGGPVGIESLAATIGENRATVEEVYEPYLVHQQLLLRTPRGRVLSDQGVKHLLDVKARY